ncbi:Helix-turn-helix domain [Streptococcus pneumoniae]|jgi:predicted DNA-binding transcriptional regulator AlpA|uniref:Helix-turn-helix domain-containing protein n=2 Tax=Pseudomonadota TaxID=1224 RepID=A0ABS9FAQ8_9PSED|nr:helix-turn-helix domain-containing protein [Stutzerimonas stutzeri]MBU1861397.1 helix-turn-helix domain-containing protein [Gammaproteobacteria bacterium]MCF4981610.1 helix-turn-helix domain-containing protein [Pseudomonas gessardii]CJL79129.1 Helix-turn-helix domain [Streptococcus pneumoniae]HBM64702.1 helix-turn-helix domain-containing protein [Pseudomonas sp.]
MTLMEVSQILRVSEHTARNRLSMGLPMPPSFRVGRRRLFLKQEVERWLAAQAGVAGATTVEPHTTIGSQVID